MGWADTSLKPTCVELKATLNRPDLGSSCPGKVTIRLTFPEVVNSFGVKLRVEPHVYLNWKLVTDFREG